MPILIYLSFLAQSADTTPVDHTAVTNAWTLGGKNIYEILA